MRKGTVQHEILEMKKSKLPGDELELLVECVADAGSLDDEVPYGLAVTLEVAEQEKINLYVWISFEWLCQPLVETGAPWVD